MRCNTQHLIFLYEFGYQKKSFMNWFFEEKGVKILLDKQGKRDDL